MPPATAHAARSYVSRQLRKNASPNTPGLSLTTLTTARSSAVDAPGAIASATAIAEAERARSASVLTSAAVAGSGVNGSPSTCGGRTLSKLGSIAITASLDPMVGGAVAGSALADAAGVHADGTVVSVGRGGVQAAATSATRTTRSAP